MAYVRFMNGANPLWDFISEMAGPEQTHNRNTNEEFDRRHRGPLGSWGWSPFDFDESTGERNPWSREMPHRPHHAHPRGPRGPRGHHHPPPPPPGAGDHLPPPPPGYSEDDARSATLQAEDHPIDMVDNDAEGNEKTEAGGPAPDPEISTPNEDEDANANESSGDEHRHRGWHGRHGRHGFPHHHAHGFGGPGFGRRGGWGGCGRGGMRGCRGGPWDFAAGPWGHGHHHPYAHARFSPRHGHGPHGPDHRRRGSAPSNPFAPWADMFGIDANNFDPDRLREVFADALQTAARNVHPRGENGNENAEGQNEETRNGENTNKNKDIDFTPAADIYDAASEYVVHFALPGAKKEDISLNWDAENSELNVAGVIAREGDEEVIKTLALDERDVGVFERKVKLGREAVDADGISAKMENGLLVVRVPKKVDDEWMEVRQVDIE